MNRKERFNQELELLKSSNALPVTALAEALGVSHMTIRRDLKILEEEKRVRLIHGGAVINPKPINYELPEALSHRVEEKIRIGRKAAEMINPGDSIILDTGSTTEQIAKALPKDMDLSVLCYSLNCLIPLSQKTGYRLYFAGGFFHKNTLMFEGPEGITQIKKSRAEIAFLSAGGIDFTLGVTCATPYETKTKQAVIASSLKRILVSDSSKFGKVSAAWFADLSVFNGIITDQGLSNEMAGRIRDMGILLYLV